LEDLLPLQTGFYVLYTMNEEWAFFIFLIALPLVICAITGIRHAIMIRGNTVSRSVAGIVCFFPILGIISNAKDILADKAELSLFYSAPMLLLLCLILSRVFRKRFGYTTKDFILMTLSVLVAGWIAFFVFAMRQLP